ncbi:MAG: hypothetical protein V3S20_07210, partial [Dehalococcoidia bacterium]
MRSLRSALLGGLALVLLAALAIGGGDGASGASAPVAAVPVCPATISFGETITCSINAGEQDFYTFAASAGDIALVRLAMGVSAPEIQLSGPGASEPICSATAFANIAEISSCTLPSDGTYTIRVSSWVSTVGGGYNLHLQRLNGPANATPISYGDTASGSIDPSAEMDAYTFNGSAGDIVLVRMWSWGPVVRLYTASGTELARDQGGVGSSFAHVLDYTLPSDGTYTVLAGRWISTVGGVYSLHLQRVNNPANATPISYGDTASGTINPRAEMDAYTFTGSAGDIVLVRMWSWAPEVWLYDEDGSYLTGAKGGVGSSFAHVLDYTLPSDGTYTILAGRWQETGGYSLHLQRVNNPANPTSIFCGDSVSGTIDPRAEMDAYTFTGSAGDIVLVRMSSWAPVIWLYYQDGSYLTGAQGGAGPSVAEISDYELPSDGTYTILAGRWLEIGGYTLSLGGPPDDGDCDDVSDATDNCPSWPNPDQSLPPWLIPEDYPDEDDPDCDGFATTNEGFVGTLPLVHCAATGVHDGIDNDGDTEIDETGEGANDEDPDAWPPDADDDQDADVGDILALFLGKIFNPPAYSPRSDFDG